MSETRLSRLLREAAECCRSVAQNDYMIDSGYLYEGTELNRHASLLEAEAARLEAGPPPAPLEDLAGTRYIKDGIELGYMRGWFAACNGVSDE